MFRSSNRAALLAAALLASGCTLMVDPSGIEPKAPAQPTGVTAIAGNGLATVHWNPRTGDVAHVRVYVGTASGALALATEVSGDSSGADVNSLTNGVLYYFAAASVDSAGTESALSDEASAMPFVPDITPPSLGATVPANAAASVAVDATLTINFSEPMDVGTVVVTAAPSTALGPPAWNDTATQVVFTPPDPLLTETSYTVTVAGKDSAGNLLPAGSQFTFATLGVPPTIQSTSPSDAAIGVPSTAAIALVFSEPMDRATVEAAFSSSPSVTCAWSWLGGDTLATCNHAAALTTSASYSVTIGTGATDAAGTHLVAPYTFSFTTAAAPDTVKPTVVSTTPAPAATGAALATNISVTFSEAVDKASAQAAFQILSPAGHSTGIFTWSTNGLTMTFNPDTDFAFGDNVSCSVSTAVKDLAGNYLAAAYPFTFRAIRQGVLNINSTAALDGFLWSSTSSVYGGTYFFTGDNLASAYSRSFVSFDLGLLPATTTRIDDATLYLYQESTGGFPYSTLGYLYADRVNYGPTLDASDLTLPIEQHISRFCFPMPCTPLYANDTYTLSTTTTTGWKSAAVLTSVANAWSDRVNLGNRCQFRMRFGTNTDGDAVNDWAVLTSGDAASNKPYLAVTYQYP